MACGLPSRWKRLELRVESSFALDAVLIEVDVDRRPNACLFDNDDRKSKAFKGEEGEEAI